MPHNLVNEGNQTHSKVKAEFPGKGMKGFLFVSLPSYQKGKGRRGSALTLGPAGFSQEVALRCSATFSYQTPTYPSKPVSAVVCPMSRDTRSRQGNEKYSVEQQGIQRAGGLNLDWKTKAIYHSKCLVCSRCFSKSHTLQVSLYLRKQEPSAGYN